MADNKERAISHDAPSGPGPAGYFVVVPPAETGPTADLGKMLGILLADWRRLLLAGFAGGLLAAVAALLLPNVYDASTVLAPVRNDPGSAAAGLRSQFGGLAALAGVELGGASGSRAEEAVATLGSVDFTRAFIEEEGLLPVLFADHWDSATKSWRDPDGAPTIGDAVRLFRNDIRSISQDRKTGLVTLRIEWTDRHLAAEWANRMVVKLNERLQAAAIEEARQRTEYLEGELAKTGVMELRQVIFNLIEGQVNAAMLANVQREYAFRVIDPALPADEHRKIRPKRAFIALGGALGLGFVFSVLLLWRRRREWLMDAPPALRPAP